MSTRKAAVPKDQASAHKEEALSSFRNQRLRQTRQRRSKSLNFKQRPGNPVESPSPLIRPGNTSQTTVRSVRLNTERSMENKMVRRIFRSCGQSIHSSSHSQALSELLPRMPIQSSDLRHKMPSYSLSRLKPWNRNRRANPFNQAQHQ